MENASKALLIAGSILIGIITIALLIQSFSSISSFQMSKLTEEEQMQLMEFNRKYTKYLGQYVYGTEVRTLMNKYDDDKLVYVKVLPEGSMPPTDVGQDTQYYKCKGVTYNDKTGRVETITFEKVTV